MSEVVIREPIQKRSIKTKEKIIEAGFDLICNDGYHNTNTSKIAKKAGVSTGIIYQYFKDKRDIFLCGLNKSADNMFYPKINLSNNSFDKEDLPNIIKDIITSYINNHKLSQIAHEEITAMSHSDKDVADFFYKKEMEITNNSSKILIENGFEPTNIKEKIHISMGLIDNLCHEIVYHKHKELDYEIMTAIVVNSIINILTKQD